MYLALISTAIVSAVICAIVLLVNVPFFKRNLFVTGKRKQAKKFISENKVQQKKLELDEDYVNFDSFFSQLRKDLTFHDKSEALISQVTKRFDKVLMNTVVDGKKFRGIAVVKCFKSFAKKEEITEETLRMCYAYGWHLEMLQAELLTYDDMMDNSLTRRGNQCWYLKDNNGVKAIDDGSFLRFFAYLPLKKYCSAHPRYLNLIHISKEIINITMLGQVMDCYTTPDGKRPNYDFLNEIRYDTIVKYKTSYYTFVLPIRAAMYFANITNESVHRDIEIVLLRIGYLFQAQDDYIDVFGEPRVTGKIGTDIEDGKCSWIAVQAYKSMDSKLKKVFEDNFARKQRVSVIKGIFEKMEIQKLFKRFEEDEFNNIEKMIRRIETKHSINMKSVRKMLNLIYKREK